MLSSCSSLFPDELDGLTSTAPHVTAEPKRASLDSALNSPAGIKVWKYWIKEITVNYLRCKFRDSVAESILRIVL